MLVKLGEAVTSVKSSHFVNVPLSQPFRLLINSLPAGKS